MIWPVALHPVSDFIDIPPYRDWFSMADDGSTYWYQGQCPHSGTWHRLPRTPLAEAIAQGLMQHLATQPALDKEGKMYGILLVATATGEPGVLKAFSGLLQGQSEMAGWVPPIPGREQVALEEARTLARLDAIQQELLALGQLPSRSQLASHQHEFESQLQRLRASHSQRKQERDQQRQNYLETLNGQALESALGQLDDQSRRDGIERRNLKRQRDAVIQPLKQQIDAADAQILSLKQQRKQLSRQLQAQMHTHYRLTNFAGASLPLHQLMPGGTMPTGTGDCCAPKLLHYAASHGLKPLAMAEFWWGPSSRNGDKLPGVFYGACAERCQPLMGFLLAGVTPTSVSRPGPVTGGEWTLPILYEDDWLIAVDKPPGLLSVPGRSRDRQDSVLSRLQLGFPDGGSLMAVHRLDQDTSGILLLARDLQTYRHLSAQFQQRRVKKVYAAVLAGRVDRDGGGIDLPLWGDPSDRPRQKVDWRRGKSSVTHFRVLDRKADRTHVEFLPVTGRTHQLRVHAADPQGLGVPIVGDRLYGDPTGTDRLYLHAKELCFNHPRSGEAVCLLAESFLWEAEGRRQEAGDRRQETGGRRQEAGGV